jgi:hypothetical protein
MSGIYWVSYRIHEDCTYTARYSAFIASLDSVSDKQWENDTTSFHIIESKDSIKSIAASLKKALNESTDNFLIRKMDSKSAIYFGSNVEFFALKKFMDYVSKA